MPPNPPRPKGEAGTSAGAGVGAGAGAGEVAAVLAPPAVEEPEQIFIMH